MGEKKTTKLSQNNKQRNPIDIKDDLRTGMLPVIIAATCFYESDITWHIDMICPSLSSFNRLGILIIHLRLLLITQGSLHKTKSTVGACYLRMISSKSFDSNAYGFFEIIGGFPEITQTMQYKASEVVVPC